MNNKNNYEHNRQWSDNLIPQVTPLILTGLKLNPEKWWIDITTPEVDMKEAADLILTDGTEKYMIALRLRNESYMTEYPFDFTIRREYTQGYKTEYEKVLEDKFADLMFYGFRAHDKVVRWVLLHMDAYRDEHVYDQRELKWIPEKHIKYEIRENHDGRNNFIGYDINSFKNPKLIIAHSPGYYDDIMIRYVPKTDGSNMPIYTLKKKEDRKDGVGL